jgi:hypothetical protein
MLAVRRLGESEVSVPADSKDMHTPQLYQTDRAEPRQAAARRCRSR